MREDRRCAPTTRGKPDYHAIAQACDKPVKRVRRILDLDQSINTEPQLHTEQKGSLLESLPTHNTAEPVAALQQSEVRSCLEGLADIGGRETQAVQQRFGLDGSDPATFQQIGDELGVTCERARQIHNTGLKKLRVLLAERGLSLDNLLAE